MLPAPGTHADVGQLLRTTGFSASPGLLRVLGGIPIAGGIVMFVVSLWMLASMVIAVRQALDYNSTGRAIVVCLIGFAVYMVVTLGLGAILGLGAAGAVTSAVPSGG
jgi:hypothetical protein